MNRKTFFKRFTLGLTALAINPFSGKAKENENSNSNSMEDKSPILNTKPLGFQWETADPFLFCVHHEDYFPKGDANMCPDPTYLKGRHLGDDFIIKDGFRMYHGKKVPGFPGHPHRGFETITVVRKGLVDHADSLGAAGRYGNGDVQWMTAGKGVQHSEMFPLIHQEKENTMELFQIWLNLPKKNKMVEPHFKMLWKESIPVVDHKDKNGNHSKIEVIAGQLNGHVALSPPPNSWAADKNNEVAVWNIRMQPNATFTIPKASKGINRTIYFYEGAGITVAGTAISQYKAIEVKADVDLVITNGNHQSNILMLQGRPINEPVMQYGPFVMNTKEEIHQAFDDYHKTQFGGWPWPRPDQVHARESGRFAKHADGRLETKS